MGNGLLNGVFGDLMEHNARRGVQREFEKECNGVGDGLAFAIIVRRQEDLAGFLGRIFQLLLDFRLLAQEREARFEVTI